MTLNEKLDRILAALRKQVEMENKTSKGPWEAGREAIADPIKIAQSRYSNPLAVIADTTLQGCANAAFIAHARNIAKPEAESLILAIETLLGYTPFVYDGKSAREVLQSIANLWPDDL